MRLSQLLKRPVADRGGESIGRLSDVIVRLRGTDYPLVTGLVVAVGGRGDLRAHRPGERPSTATRCGCRARGWTCGQFERRDGEVLLRADVLGHRLIDVENARLVRAADLELDRDGAEWVLSGVDTRRRPRRLFGLLAPEAAGRCQRLPRLA